MRSVLALTLLVGSMVVACSAPSVGAFPDGSSADTKLPTRDPNADSSTTDDGTSTTTSADTAPAKPATGTTATLTIASQGDGTGTFTSSPAGVACTGGACTGSFASGTSVTLTATPTVGSIFTGWTGGGCTGTSTCVTTVSAAAQVTAQFITLAGSWSGTYTNVQSNFGCTFNNAGNLQQTLTTSDNAAYTTAVAMTGFQIKDQDCNLQGTLAGNANPSAATVSGSTVTGSWDVGLDGVGDIQLPFTATVTGTTMTGKWTCSGCTGGFNLTKAAATTGN